MPVPAYAELQATSNFSFLRGAAHPKELVHTAHALGLSAIAIADRNTLAGVVRAHMAAKQCGMRLVIGCRLDLQDGPSLIALPTDRAAYGRLTRLITRGKMCAPKGECHLWLDDVSAHGAGQTFILLPPETVEPAAFERHVRTVSEALPAPLFLAAHHLYRGDDRRRIAMLDAVATACGTPLVATGDVHYHVRERRPLQDVLTCIREHCTVADAGFRLHANAERHLKGPEEMARLFAGFEHALARTVEIAQGCRFSLDTFEHNYPEEAVPEGRTPQGHLETLAWEGAARFYPGGLPEKVRDAIAKELGLIAELGYASYFLTVHDIVQWARAQEPPILCQGRGSAANSAVCFALGITAVDPMVIDLLFERFVSKDRGEPPDIDVDFEHERREEVMQYIYDRYGRTNTGIAATVISYRARSAVREVGKAMGLTEDVTSALAGTVWGWSDKGLPDDQVREAGLDPDDPNLRRTLALSAELIGFPRHLSQHVGGFVLSRDPLDEIVPIGNAAMKDRTFVEWDKDDLDAVGLLKVDVLSLGMLTCIRKCFDLIRDHWGRDHVLSDFSRAEDEATYDMLCKADSLGVFQVESRAQMNMLPRLKPRDFYDLVIEVAIVRPGPIQGDMVHPYLRRRNGEEDVEYPPPAKEHGPPDELEHILRKTLGVPIFQEQAMRIAAEAARFTTAEVNELRYAMATFRRRGTIELLEEKMVGRMIARGYDPDFAQSCFNQIKGFGEYGFPESHAASFALLVFVSAWLKCHYPAAFACGLLNSQPMGFYAPAQIVRDAREHGVEVRPVDVNFSELDNTLEPAADDPRSRALRLGLRQVDGLGEEIGERLAAARDAPFETVHDLWHRADIPVAALEKLAAADALRSLGLDRRQALWEVRALKAQKPLPLFAHAQAREEAREPPVALPPMPEPEHVIVDYQTLRLSLKAHPLSFLRDEFARRGLASTRDLRETRDGRRLALAGVVLVRQRPGSAKGVVFMTLEDEFGIANTVVWPRAFEAYRRTVMGARLVFIRGRIQRQDDIVHLVADHLEDWTPLLLSLAGDEPAFTPPYAHGDEAAHAANPSREVSPRRHPRNVRIIPKSRDFH